MTDLILRHSYLKNGGAITKLAIENQILVNMPKNTIHLLFWVNDPCVVMGRFQNPFLECKLEKLSRDNVLLIRRQSGGGCVYHDKGNINYSFVCSKDLHDKNKNHQIIINALKEFCIDAYSTKRVDLFVDTDDGPKKFSGSAFKEKKDSALHHGTLLVDSNIDKLNYYLTPKDSDIKSVSIPSVRSKVVNLKSLNSSISIDGLIKAIIGSYESFYSQKSIEVDKEVYDESYLNELSSAEWILGETPKFTLNSSFYVHESKFEIMLEIKKLKILNLALSGSNVHSGLYDELASSIVGINLVRDNPVAVIKAFKINYPMYEDFLTNLEVWFKDNFNGLHMIRNHQMMKGL